MGYRETPRAAAPNENQADLTIRRKYPSWELRDLVVAQQKNWPLSIIVLWLVIQLDLCGQEPMSQNSKSNFINTYLTALRGVGSTLFTLKPMLCFFDTLSCSSYLFEISSILFQKNIQFELSLKWDNSIGIIGTLKIAKTSYNDDRPLNL